MRDWKRIDSYLTRLAQDIYPQPEDPGHTTLAQKVIDFWMSRMTSCTSVLDLGCGTGFTQDMFERWNIGYTGVCLGEDFLVAQEKNRNVKKMDFHFLDFPDNNFDLLFARHSLEHSPMPLLALMEWERVAVNWLGIVLPAPEWYTYKGLNHYAVMNMEQIEILLTRAGWRVMWKNIDELMGNKTEENPQGHSIPHEYWLMCERSGI